MQRPLVTVCTIFRRHCQGAKQEMRMRENNWKWRPVTWIASRTGFTVHMKKNYPWVQTQHPAWVHTYHPVALLHLITLSTRQMQKRDIDISRRKQSQHAQCLSGQAKERLNNEANSDKQRMVFGLTWTNDKCDVNRQFFQSGWTWLNLQMQWSRRNALSLVWVSLLEADTVAPRNLDWAGGFFLPCFLFGLSPQKSDQRSGKRPGLWVRGIVEMCSTLLLGSSGTECKLIGAMVQTYSNNIKQIAYSRNFAATSGVSQTAPAGKKARTALWRPQLTNRPKASGQIAQKIFCRWSSGFLEDFQRCLECLDNLYRCFDHSYGFLSLRCIHSFEKPWAEACTLWPQEFGDVHLPWLFASLAEGNQAIFTCHWTTFLFVHFSFWEFAFLCFRKHGQKRSVDWGTN